MTKTTLASIIFYSIFMVIILGCDNSELFTEVLNGAKEQLKNTSTLKYTFKTNWDNRFNETTFSDSAAFTYSKVDSSLFGFGFYAKRDSVQFIFDGINFYEINHSNQQIVFYDHEEIKSDSNYFESFMYFGTNPLELLPLVEFGAQFKTVKNHKDFYVYKTEEFTEPDSTRKIQRDQLYFIDSEAKELNQIQNVTIINEDTAQIIDTYFTDFEFQDSLFDFTKIDHRASFNYEAIHENDEERARFLKQIKEGDTLKRQAYLNLLDQETPVYGDAESETLIMFSFIGCGGCEYAMREMRKREYRTKDGINLVYSSPADKKSPLKKYLNKKEFPFTGFSKESNMNDDFSVYSFPTYVLVDSEGIVKDVLQDYDKVEKILFENPALKN